MHKSHLIANDIYISVKQEIQKDANGTNLGICYIYKMPQNNSIFTQYFCNDGKWHTTCLDKNRSGWFMTVDEALETYYTKEALDIETCT